MKHFLSIDDLDVDSLTAMLDLSEQFVAVNQRDIPKVPALRGKVVASLFYEDSTRTRLSFETAAKRLSCDVMTFSVAQSSVKKGESLRDTVQTIAAMGIDAIVVRHPAAGAPHRIVDWIDASVINAGDGRHAHPTQALLDVLTLRRHRELAGLRVAIVGDVRHSRVARSNVKALHLLGAEVTLVAPPTLLPESLEGWPVQVSHELDHVISEVDVVMLLRMQFERQQEALFPTVREYTARYGLTEARAERLKPDALVMHPGPMNRGRRGRRRGRRRPRLAGHRTGRQRRRRPHGRALFTPRKRCELLPEIAASRVDDVIDATGRRVDADVLVRDGVVVDVAPDLPGEAACLDASGCVVAPGAGRSARAPARAGRRGGGDHRDRARVPRRGRVHRGGGHAEHASRARRRRGRELGARHRAAAGPVRGGVVGVHHRRARGRAARADGGAVRARRPHLHRRRLLRRQRRA